MRADRRESGLHSPGALCSKIPLRDVDHPEDPPMRVRAIPESGVRAARPDSEGYAGASGPGARYPAYNYIIHTAPIGETAEDYYHWHLEIMPKLTKVAGFEWGTGFYINPTPPEVSAKFLREAAQPVETPAVDK